MAKRNLLLGFGAGLIAAAGVISLVSVPVPPAATSLSKDQLRAAAEEMGLVLVPKDDYQKLKEGQKEAASPTVKTPVPPSSPQPTAKPETDTSTIPTPPKAPVSNQSTSAPVQPQTPKRAVSVTIPYRASAEDVEKLLVKAGVLQRENRFVETLRAQDKLDRIRVGTYQMTAGTPEEQIVKLITTPPKK
jgi:hypothetical protein